MGVLFAFGSAVFFALANMGIGSSSRRFGALPALVWAQLIGLLLVIPAAFVIQGTPVVPDHSWLPLLVAGFAAVAAYSGLFLAFGTGQLSVVAPLVSSWSVIAVLTAIVWPGEPLRLIPGLGVLCVVAGNAALARISTHPDSPTATPWKAFGYAGLSAVGFGVMVPALDVAAQGIGPLWTIPGVWGIELCLLTPLAFWHRASRQLPRGRDWIQAGRAGLLEVTGFICIVFAVTNAPIVVVGPISSLSTAFSVALGVVVLGEHVPKKGLVAAGVACMGVVLVNL